MDDIRDELNTTLEPPEQRDPREVVLQYAPAVQSVTEYYVQPTPYPGRPAANEEDWEDEPPRRKRRWPWVLAACALLFLLGAGYWFFLIPGGDELPEYDDEENFRFEWQERIGLRGKNETTIARYPNGDGTRLLITETRGDALSAQEVYRLVNPCTVTVVTSMGDGSALVGTGVIMTADGYILTNAHVIAGGTRCTVALSTGYRYDAKLLGLDEEQDLAVIKVDGHGLPVAAFGDSDALTVGDPVYAIGNPLGVELRGTLTDGIVSAINRDVDVDGIAMTLIQTNAALNNGNSGGPLINCYGQVVGINTMKMGSTASTTVEGLGFAIPISSSAYMVDDLIACGKIRGEPVFGITVLTDAINGTVTVNSVTPGGPGDLAGVQQGDVILAAEGEEVHSAAELIRIRRRYRAGDTLTLHIYREGAGELDAELTLAEADW